MAFDCSGDWNSCINSTESVCLDTDPNFEGTMVIKPPNPSTGLFTGKFFPVGGGAAETIEGQCSDQKPHMQVWRGLHYYNGNKTSAKNVKGKHRKLRIVNKGRRVKPLDDDEWVATKTTKLHPRK